jgi:hypothetical protein
MRRNAFLPVGPIKSGHLAWLQRTADPDKAPQGNKAVSVVPLEGLQP